MVIAIYGSRRQDPYLDTLTSFFEQLKCRHIDVVMHSKLYNYLEPLIAPGALDCVAAVSDDGDSAFEADLAVSIGGDGTFLRTAMWVAGRDIPIVGVNTGHLGYLSAIPVGRLTSLLQMIEDGAFRAEHRSLLQVVEPQLKIWPYALNEVAVTKCDRSSMIVARTLVDGSSLADYKADGLIVATPTGSTAYNLSVGGPIVQPAAPVMVLSPIAAHSLSMRPLVISDESEISITVNCRKSHFRLSLDGRSVLLDEGTTVVMRRAPFVITALQLAEHDFASTLRDKLSWAE